MENSSVPKVRWVRCPKCRVVLPEPSDVPVYRCGGCETVLQAKHYKKENVVEDQRVHGGEASTSNLPPVMDQNEGIDQRSAQKGNLELQPGVSDSSREASSNECSPPSHEEPSKSDPRTDEVEEDSGASMSDRSMEQISVPQIVLEGGEGRQGVIVAEDQLEAADSSSGVASPEASLNECSPPGHEEPSKSDPHTDELEKDSGASLSDGSMEQISVPQIVLESRESRQGDQLEAADSSSGAASPWASTAKTDSDAYEPNQNASMNCRLEQPQVLSFPAEALLSDEPSLHEANSSPRVPAEVGEIESTEVKEQLEVSGFRSEPAKSSNEPTVGEDELSSQLGSPNQHVMTTELHLAASNWERQPESGVRCEDEASSIDESVSILERSASFQSIGADQEKEADNVVNICGMDENVTSSNQSTLLGNNPLSRLVTENQELVDEARVQNALGICNEDHVVDPNDKIILPSGVNLKATNQPAYVLPESEKISGSSLSSGSEVSTAPDESRNSEPRHSAEGDAPAYGNNIIPSLPTLKTTVGAEVLNLDDRSQNNFETNPREKIEEFQKAAPNSLETTETADTHFEATTSYEDEPNSKTRSSFHYDGNDRRQGVNRSDSPTAEDQRQRLSERNRTYDGSRFPRDMDNLQSVPVGEDESYHSEAHKTPVMLNEIRISEVLSDVTSRRGSRTPRTREFPSRVRSQDMRYESSDLVYNDFYDNPSYRPPYQYRDVESRVTTRRHRQRSDVDGRMISEAVWMGEEFRMHPYPELSSEFYPHPRHQMYYHERRESAYHQPLVHSMAGERPRSGYRVLDSYSYQLYPDDRRWSSHLPPPGLSYSRGRYAPREPFDSYNASPEYYPRSHDTISEDPRMSRMQPRRRAHHVKHIQPIGGAAPFITCYQCSELLQLPPDFVLFKGVRIHRVKCSACTKILRFKLEKGRHLVPDVPQPLSPLREYAESHHSQADHDYEALHRRSASTSTSNYGRGSEAQISDRVSIRSSSQAPARQRSNAESHHSQDKGKRVMAEVHRPAKVTWKNEDRSSSPLHRLMGYSSPSAVLNPYGSPGDSERQREYSRN